MMNNWMTRLGVALCVAPLACAHADVETERAALDTWRPDPAPDPSWSADEEVALEPSASADIDALEGELGRFVGYALRRSPELQAAHARWASAVEGAVVAGRLPEPELGYGGFVRAVETRVGPQRHRISLKQAFPWPGRLDAATDARAATAAAEGEAFRARVLDLVRDVAAAYWDLWRVERTHAIRLDHERVLEGLIATIRARVETGEKSIAELLQVQLRLEALRDHRTRHHSEMRQDQARLLAAVGADPGVTIETAATEPPVELPAETMAALRAHASENPLVARWTDVESARVAEARAARKKRQGSDRPLVRAHRPDLARLLRERGPGGRSRRGRRARLPPRRVAPRGRRAGVGRRAAARDPRAHRPLRRHAHSAGRGSARLGERRL
jgi:outer membrane protein TolC